MSKPISILRRRLTAARASMYPLQGYLSHKKKSPPPFRVTIGP